MEARMPQNSQSRLLTLFAVGCCLAYFSIAFYVTAMGAAASSMMQRWAIDGAAQGLILTVQSVGGIVLSILFIFLGSRLNKARAVLFGLAVLLAGYALMALLPNIRGGYGALLLIAIPVGLGFTTIDVMVNGVLVDTYGEKSGTVLPFAHATYSVGATLSPLIASLLINPDAPATYGRTFAVGGAVCLIALLCVLIAANALRRAGTPLSAAPSREDGVSGGAILKKPRAWLYLICGLFYFCFLWGVTAWLPSYCQSVPGFDYRLSTLAASGFFLGALIMRFLSPLLFLRMKHRRVFLLSSALSALCMLGAALAAQPSVILPLVVLSGFFQGTVVICLVMMCCAAFPNDTAGASSLAVLAGTLGMFIAPYIMGMFSSRASFRASMLFAVACLLIAFVLAAATREKRADDG